MYFPRNNFSYYLYTHSFFYYFNIQLNILQKHKNHNRKIQYYHLFNIKRYSCLFFNIKYQKGKTLLNGYLIKTLWN